jgi:hypothetical protein
MEISMIAIKITMTQPRTGTVPTGKVRVGLYVYTMRKAGLIPLPYNHVAPNKVSARVVVVPYELVRIHVNLCELK